MPHPFPPPTNPVGAPSLSALGVVDARRRVLLVGQNVVVLDYATIRWCSWGSRPIAYVHFFKQGVERMDGYKTSTLIFEEK